MWLSFCLGGAPLLTSLTSQSLGVALAWLRLFIIYVHFLGDLNSLSEVIIFPPGWAFNLSRATYLLDNPLSRLYLTREHTPAGANGGSNRRGTSVCPATILGA